MDSYYLGALEKPDPWINHKVLKRLNREHHLLEQIPHRNRG